MVSHDEDDEDVMVIIMVLMWFDHKDCDVVIVVTKDGCSGEANSGDFG